MTTLIVVPSLTPSGLLASLLFVVPPPPELLLLPAQASRKPTAGTATRPAAAARLSIVRRLRADGVDSTAPVFSGERDILVSSYFGSGGTPDTSGVLRLEGVIVLVPAGDIC